MESLIPTTIAYVTSQIYCYYKKIPFFVDGTKSIPKKLAINGRNLLVGITTNAIITFLHGFTPIESICIIEEGVRMGIYSLMVEFWFYWSHRIMHENKWLYTNVHREHHLETIPSPIDAYILTISESISVTIAFACPIIIGFGITRRGAILVQTIHLIYGILVHGGLPGVTHHMEHHKYFNGNYCGVYPLWDNVFGTRLPKYEHVDDVKAVSVKVVNRERKIGEKGFVKRKGSRWNKSTMKPIRHIKGKPLCMNVY